MAMQRLLLLVSVLIMIGTSDVECQDPDDTWWDILKTQGKACKNDTCRRNDKTCECYLTIEHRLTMMNEKDRILLVPSGGRFRPFNYLNEEYSKDEEEECIAGDGYGSRMVIAVNRRFPGPQITAYENQNIIVHMRNLMHTDSTTIHFHGIHQKRTPWSDGVAFVSQCPILPGQIYTYSFYAKPFGTSFYHAHIGDQRSAGLYGPLVIIPLSSVNISTPQDDNDGKVHTVAIQDWNHFDDPETLYQRMLFGTFDLQENKQIDTTSDVSGARFSRFHCHSGIINGKGRFYSTSTTHNQAPLTIYDVEPNTDYRFRVIGAATLYPFRVFIQGHRTIRIVASDGFEIEPIEVESLIIHPGERIDFILRTDQVSNNYLLVAETLEEEPERFLNQYHAAEAIIHYTDAAVNLNPPKGSPNSCSQQNKCRIFNCPFMYYPQDQNRICLTWNDAKTIDPNSNIDEVKGEAIERFYNFAFPGENGYTPGSVNGHQFLPPTVAAYAEWDKVEQNCGECSDSSICECTYYDTIDRGNTDQVYQFVMTNIGNGSGWSHPIHLHGHSFYVMKMGFASYNQNDGKLTPNRGQDQQDIICNDGKNFCNNAQWRNSTWSNGSHPTLNWDNPPQKDTIIVPTGAYVVIRFKADNPGLWFFHCHIDVHNTNGMGMMINESPGYHQKVPDDFPRCKSYIVNNDDADISTTQSSSIGSSSGVDKEKEKSEGNLADISTTQSSSIGSSSGVDKEKEKSDGNLGLVIGIVVAVVTVIVVIIVIIACRRRKNKSPPFKNDYNSFDDSKPKPVRDPRTGDYDYIALEDEAPKKKSSNNGLEVEDIQKHNEEYLKKQAEEEKRKNNSNTPAQPAVYVQVNEASKLKNKQKIETPEKPDKQEEDPYAETQEGVYDETGNPHNKENKDAEQFDVSTNSSKQNSNGDNKLSIQTSQVGSYANQGFEKDENRKVATVSPTVRSLSGSQSDEQTNSNSNSQSKTGYENMMGTDQTGISVEDSSHRTAL